MDKRRLAVLADEPSSDEASLEGLPEPWGVLYQRPNMDGSRKSCGNCMMWVETSQCVIHDPELEIDASYTCGYYVFGDPHTGDWADQRHIQYVTPELSGLEQVPGGTSCDICVHYTKSGPIEGSCDAVRDPDIDGFARVDALGCCAAWKGK